MQIRPTTVTVDLAAIRHNLRMILELAPGLGICAVVKADAYGHGLRPVGRTLAHAGVDWLAVALIEEGMALRAEGVETPILVLGAALEGGFEELVANRLVPAVFRPDHLESLARAAGGQHPVAAARQRALGELQDAALVLDHDDVLVAPG